MYTNFDRNCEDIFMILNDRIKEKLPITDFSNYYVVADFDRTITNGSSKTSWSILASSELVPKCYVEEREELFNKYRPIELDESMDFSERSRLVREWFFKHIQLFIKYKISEEVFEKAGHDLRVMEFRTGAAQFLEFLHKENIPVIIISAGIGNFIESFFKANNAYYDNIYISSNKIIFKDGIASGVGENIIHSLNKNEVSLPDEIKGKLAGRDKVILLGDQISDLMMVDETKHNDVLKIGFYSSRSEVDVDYFASKFDIVCLDNDDYNNLIDMVF